MPAHADLARHPRRRPTSGRRRTSGRPRLYCVTDLLCAYALAVSVLWCCLLLEPALALIALPAAGIVLSRFIGRRIVWWNQADSLKNVSSAKLHMVLTWPVSMPPLIARIFVSKFF